MELNSEPLFPCAGRVRIESTTIRLPLVKVHINSRMPAAVVPRSVEAGARITVAVPKAH